MSKTADKTTGDKVYEPLPGNIADLFAAAQAAAQAGALDEFEAKFTADNAARWAKWGPEIHLSRKQLDILKRCAGKAGGATEDASAE